MIPRLREAVLRRLARVLIRSGTFRRQLGELDANFDPRFLRAASLLRDASGEEAGFIRDLVKAEDNDIALWVLHETKHKTGGFFVEFGAADGIAASTTYPLEKEFGWRGILAEPNPSWHHALQQNRQAAIDARCVFTASGARVKFAVTESALLATMTDYVSCDGHAQSREHHHVIEVETVSLNDLLIEHDAPCDIDFVSIDTEGSEYDILQAFDFDHWRVRLFSVEHNRTVRQAQINELMTRNGYEQRYPDYPIIDSWYRRVDRG